MTVVFLQARRPRVHLAAAGVLLVCVAFPGAARSPVGKQGNDGGELSGRVTRAYACPTKRSERPCSAEPAKGVKIRVLTLAGKEITSLVTDAQGMYSITLAPGTYRMEANLTSSEKTDDLPANVTIQNGKRNALDVCIQIERPEAQPSAKTGVLLGGVTLGPISPLGFRTEPMSSAQIIISSLDRSEIKSVVTDDQGRFSISLSPGKYRVVMPHLPPRGRFTKNLPATVTIVEGQETCLDVLLDKIGRAHV